MFKLIQAIFTRNKTKIPLLWITFDYNKYKSKSAKDSCLCHLHPLLKDDKYLKALTNEIVDYIRTNYNMEEI